MHEGEAKENMKKCGDLLRKSNFFSWRVLLVVQEFFVLISRLGCREI